MVHNADAFDPAFRSELTRLLTWRRDVRHFLGRPLPEGALARLVGLAALAPSVGLSQPWRFVSVEAPERRAAIRAEFARCNAEALAAEPRERQALYARLKLEGLDQAPVHLAVFADPSTPQGHGLGRRTMPEALAYSVVMAVHTLWLAARAEGIGMGWVSILDPARVAAVLDVPDAWQFIGYLCLGYPADEHEVPELERRGWERRARQTLLSR
ncbi:5,6-dimethylbenzimidazole synthase [Phreatobacter stygius]|uniref:5,6-dimethylbenzimidazole synthase n=1 Tax=Phreatobacter stygius TaxID=1940610 RepID=A0A4D7B8H9_9HYPH|nr:5,6-dimethylbenzimidazole synthase [Phreatobacter stygius]QCI67245.1 5,6-dimethylbenzimidazole synthase [Phreatobacter stygius]